MRKKMSFQDVATEEGRSRRSERGESEGVAAGIFKINTAVSSFYRLVNSLGTPKDTLQLRQNVYDVCLFFPFSFIHSSMLLLLLLFSLNFQSPLVLSSLPFACLTRSLTHSR